MIRTLPFIAGLALATPAAAQTSHDLQLWGNLGVQGSIAGDLVYLAELQPRWSDDVSRFDLLLLRGAIGYRLNPRLTVHGGYVHVTTPVDDGADRIEQRAFQQLTWAIPVTGPGHLSTRFRLEQRWRSDGHDVGWRARQTLRYAHPLSAHGGGVALLGAGDIYFALNDTDWGLRAGLDQLRGFVGVEIPLRGKSTAEIGYLNRTTNRRAGRITVDHIASFSIVLRP